MFGPKPGELERENSIEARKGSGSVTFLLIRWASRRVNTCESCSGTRHSVPTFSAHGPLFSFQILFFSVVNPNLEICRDENCGKYYHTLTELSQYQTTICRRLPSVPRMQGGGEGLKYTPGFIPSEVVLLLKPLGYIVLPTHAGRKEKNIKMKPQGTLIFLLSRLWGGTCRRQTPRRNGQNTGWKSEDGIQKVKQGQSDSRKDGDHFSYSLTIIEFPHWKSGLQVFIQIAYPDIIECRAVAGVSCH